jgi:hypothetical protein
MPIKRGRMLAFSSFQFTICISLLFWNPLTYVSQFDRMRSLLDRNLINNMSDWIVLLAQASPNWLYYSWPCPSSNRNLNYESPVSLHFSSPPSVCNLSPSWEKLWSFEVLPWKAIFYGWFSSSTFIVWFMLIGYWCSACWTGRTWCLRSHLVTL